MINFLKTTIRVDVIGVVMVIKPLEPSETFKQFQSYAFAAIDQARDKAKQKGYNVIDFGVGDPTDPLYEGSIKAIQEGAEIHKQSGYPSYIGMPKFRQAAADWMERRFGVKTDPDTQITSTIGSKEAVWVFPFAYINPGDKVLIPSIGYPPYKSGTVFAKGIPVYYDLKEENGFLPDFDEIEKTTLSNMSKTNPVKIMWINSPHNPITIVYGKDTLEKAIELSDKYGFLLALDEAYSEMYREGDEKPLSTLQLTDNLINKIIFQSVSKRSNATGIRVGFAVGDENVIKNYRALRTQVDSGTPNCIQEGAIAAWKDETHVKAMREMYDKRRDIITTALKNAGLREPYAEATFYVWQPVPEGMTSADFTALLMQLSDKEKLGINTAPGSGLSLSGPIGDRTPGEGFVRFALVPSEDDTRIAAQAIEAYLPEKIEEYLARKS